MTLEKAIEDIGEPEKPPGEDWSSGWPQSATEFEAFIAAFQDKLVRYAFRRLRDFHEAEDVIQEVFLKAYTKRREMCHVARVAPYLYRMAANLCTDRLRRRHPVLIPLDEIGPEDVADTRSTAVQVVGATESLQYTDSLLARLPKAQAEELRLRVLDDLSLEEIAAMQGCSMEAVKSRIRYALRKLRRIVSRTRENVL